MSFDHHVEKLFVLPKPVTAQIRGEANKFVALMCSGGGTAIDSSRLKSSS
jgi:hypothetical protein